jgi:methyl-accepting chemotaxis protein
MLSHFTKHLAIKKRILSGFAAIILIITVAMGYLHMTSRAADGNVNDMVATNNRLLTALEFAAAFQDQRIIAHRYVLTFDPADEKAFAQAKATSEEKINLLSQDLDAAHKETVTKIVALKDAYAAAFGRVTAIAKDTSLDEAARRAAALDLLRGQMRQAANDALKEISTLEKNMEESFRAEEKNVHDAMLAIQVSVLVAAAASIGLSVLIALLIGGSIANPVTTLSRRMSDLANGDKTTAIPFADNRDEVGNMARQVEVFRDNAIKVDQMTAEQEELKRKAEAERKAAMLSLADDFDHRTKQVVETLVAAATQMKSTAQSMNAGSQATAQASSIVAAAALEADSNVQTVAAAAEELTATSQEIARQISSTAKRTAQASSEAQSTSEAVNELNILALAIGDVVGAIRDIAEQTNLLALNATIEAARAGEAGKGFAVVADEVKKLANETATKTEEISGRVQKIQAAVKTSVESVARIIEGVQEINQMTGAVAAAVEEQSAATSEIGRNVSEASTGTQQVSVNISEVQKTATEAGESSRQVLQAANDIGDVSAKLKEQIDGFLNEIRQA